MGSAKRRDEIRIKSTKLEEKVHNFKEKKNENTKRNIVSQFRETTRNTFFRNYVFFSVSRNDLNSAKQ